jgi:hypothetical protein
MEFVAVPACSPRVVLAVLAMSRFARFSTGRVESGKTHSEQIISAIPPLADIDLGAILAIIVQDGSVPASNQIAAVQSCVVR